MVPCQSFPDSIGDGEGLQDHYRTGQAWDLDASG